MVEIDFLAANHVRIVGLCGQNWNRTLGYYVAYVWNVVKYLTTVEWTTRPQCIWAWPAVGTGRWALAVHSSQFAV